MLQFGKYSISIKFTRVLAVQMETTKKHIELSNLDDFSGISGICNCNVSNRW